MRVFKIIIGIVLLYGAGKEYINASTQVGSFFDIGIIIAIVLFLFLCTWLIATGFSKQKLQLKSFSFLKYFIISFLIFALFSLFNLSRKAIPSDFVNINGIRIPLGKCIEGNSKVIPDLEERKSYCLCFAEKIVNDSTLRSEYKVRLENDKFSKVILELQNTPAFIELDFENCLKSVKMVWTYKMIKSIKKTWKKALLGSEFEKTNDVDAYCDCLIKEYRIYPLRKVMEDGFFESNIATEIQEKCTKESEKKN
ncbi:hypothetical protein [Kordia sp.]|uniref:hypothetical protein n=1 Tax=Kordia sp. TaxID=1965332 RepID=UPI003D6C1051